MRNSFEKDTTKQLKIQGVHFDKLHEHMSELLANVSSKYKKLKEENQFLREHIESLNKRDMVGKFQYNNPSKLKSTFFERQASNIRFIKSNDSTTK